MKTMKRTKSKGNGNSYPRSPDLESSSDDREMTFKASFEDLRNPDGRQSLRQHFTGAFPEAQRKTSYSSISSHEPKSPLSRSTSNLSVNTYDAGASSSSSINSVGAKHKRLSTVQENNTVVDIAQAIQLLQELKKTASPEELVALHKALLPTRDSIIVAPSLPVNEDDPTNVSSAPMIRRRSLLPPGLATRGSASEDLLRKQEDLPVVKKVKKRISGALSLRLSHSASHGSLAALDLADDAAQAQDHLRPSTPSDQEYTQMGLYRHGTLRVINGAASPEPPALPTRNSTELKVDTAGPQDSRKQSSNHTGVPLDLRASQDYCTAPTTPLDRASQEFYLARTGTRESLNMRDGSNPSSKNSPRQQSAGRQRSRRPSDADARSREPSQSRSTRPSHTRDSSISGIPVPCSRDESTPRIYKRTRTRRSRDESQSTPASPERSKSSPAHSRIPLPVEALPLRPTFNMLEPQVSQQSLTPVRPDIDDGRISPEGPELPRYAQRWSHRASKLSENAAEGDLTANPYVDKPTLSQYENRASLLKKLNTIHANEASETTADTVETPEIALARLNGIQVQQPAKQQHRKLVGGENAMPSPRFGDKRPVPLQHSDSGYGTDASFQKPSHRLSNDGHLPAHGGDDDDDGQSLYTFDQFLRSQSLLDHFSTPSPPAASGKKHSSFLKITGARRGSSKPSTPEAPAEAIETRKKKLQKPMPASVRKERKAQAKKTDTKGDAPEAEASRVNTASSIITSSHPRFSFEPTTKPPSRPSTSGAVTELKSDSQPALAELNGDTNLPAADDGHGKSRTSFIRARSKSRGRGRERTSLRIVTGQKDLTDSESEHAPRGGDKNAIRSGKTTPTRSAFDVGPVSSINPKNEDADEDIPLWTDHASISRALGSSPYDPSTNMFKRTVSVPAIVMHQVQSPHSITTSFGRAKSGGLKGMDSGMASELARMKSRDVAVKNNEEVYDRPRTAKPRSRSRGASKPTSPARPRAPSDDRYSGSESRSATPRPSSEPLDLPERRLSTYSESIPPMPELPANVRAKVSKIVEMATKKPKDSAHPSPELPEAVPRPSVDRSGYSTISVADAVRKAMESRQGQDKDRDAVRRKSTRARRARQTRQNSFPREMISSSSDEAINVQTKSKVREREEAHTTSSSQQEHESVPTVWEKQAKLWRERRESIGESLGKPVATDSKQFAKVEAASSYGTSTSPALLVSEPTTPQFPAYWPTRRRTDSATQHADAYRDLIGESQENVDEPASFKVATRVTVQRYSKQEYSSSSASALSVVSPQNTGVPMERARSPGGRVICPSGSYHPYTPADSERAERSRAESLAKLTGAAVESSRKSLERIPLERKSLERKSLERKAFDAQPQVVVHARKDVEEAFYDRYSGGLQYNYERGIGVGGSAGTRAKGDRAGRKSRELSEGLGLDLSDVPFFMQKKFLGPMTA